MAHSIKNQPYDTFFEDSLTSFEAQLESLFPKARRKLANNELEDRVFRINGDNALYEMVKNKVAAKGTFPFITTRLGGWGPNTEGYNSFDLKRKGIPVRVPKAKDSDQLDYLILHPEPVLTRMAVSFIAQNEKDAIFFSKRWYDSIKNGYFDYQLMVYNTPFEIKVRGEPDIEFPDPAEIAQDAGNMYLVETQGALLHTYIVTTERNPAIKRYTIKGYNDLPPKETLIDRSRTVEDLREDEVDLGTEWPTKK